MPIQPGDILRGKYRLDTMIGRGGMGNVYAATELESQAAVAIKVVSRVFFDEVLMQRLHREAEAASKIQSDFVPRVLEVNETEEAEVFLVMERLVGMSLSERMRKKDDPMTWKQIAQVGEDVLRGLIDAHTAGIVHRDLKPSNVFLALKQGRERAMVLDFGVCKIDGVDAERLTGTGESIGTVAYMAPEQIRGASKVDDRADLYAFGAVVFEMACGRLPHEGPSQMAILASKLERDADRIRAHARIEVPAGLDELVAKTLAREPGVRPQSAQELLRGWRQLSGKQLSVPTPGGSMGLSMPTGPVQPVPMDEAPTSNISFPSMASVVPPEPRTETAYTAGTSLGRNSNGRLAFVLAACGLVAGFIAVAAFFARSSEPANAATIPPPTEATAPPTEATTTPTPSVTAASAEPEPSIELPTDEAPVAKKTAPVNRPRPNTSGTTKPGTPKGPHITEKPRF